MAFPDNVQTFLRAVDPSTTLDAQNIQTYQNFIEQGDFAGAQNFLAQMTNGNAMNLNASRYNELVQTIEDIQNFYFGLNGVEDYINDNISAYSNIAVYNNNTNYSVGNIAQKNGAYYRCIQANGPATTVVEPTVTSDWESYWELFIQPQEPKQYPIQAEQPTGQAVGDLWFQLIPFTYNWAVKTWNRLTNFEGNNIWTDGTNIYYSYNDTQYVLNRNSATWSTKAWNGLTNFTGAYVWTDGENIYYSNTTNQYVLNKDTSTWTPKVWNGLTNFFGNYIWTDGTNIYYSYSDTNEQYVLNKDTSTWATKVWNGLSNFGGGDIWTDGTNIYCSRGSSQYVLDVSADTWNEKSWAGYNPLSGSYIWTDGENIYYSQQTNQYVLDKNTSTWNEKSWDEISVSNFYGSRVWTDNYNIYYSYQSYQYVLQRTINN